MAVGLLVACNVFAGDLRASETDVGLTVLPSLTVTASRTALPTDELSLQLIAIEGSVLRESLVLDAALGRIAGFSLFRRTGSLAANPTTQGASLRGIGPSGASRSLVLLDGVPFNDAFGGWVNWGQIQLAAIERVEVVRGGGSSTWGNTALGGVIQVVSRLPEAGGSQFATSYGSDNTTDTYLYFATSEGALGVALSGRYFSTDGYQRVSAEQRGAVDLPTHARQRSAGVNAVYDISPQSRLRLSAGIFDEDRGNGTVLANNATLAWRLHARLDWGAGAPWRADIYFTESDYSSTFSSVSEDRSSERLVVDQYAVPSESFGGSVRRLVTFGEELQLALGMDLRGVEGETREFVVFQGAERLAGGSQMLAGAFAELNGGAEQLQWQLALRGDRWEVRDGFIQQPNADRVDFVDREESLWNARAGASYQIAAPARLRGAVYQAYRVPTINELYRPFQVGSDVTQANASLEPERLLGIEAGAEIVVGQFSAGLTGYLNEVRDPVLNVTIGSTGQGGELRQRRNIDRTRILGLEADIKVDLNESWQALVSFALTDARIVQAAAQRTLEGMRLAQVPREVLTVRLGRDPGSSGFGGYVALRWSGAQFEDDRNLRQLEAYHVIDVSVTYRLSPGRELYLSADNAFNHRYPDGISGAGIITEGAPRQLRGGVRWQF